MADEEKIRCCKVCTKDLESRKKHGRRCDGCKAITCRHVCTSKGDEDFCPICTLRARKAEKAKNEKPPAPTPKPKAKPEEKPADDTEDEEDDAEEEEAAK